MLCKNIKRSLYMLCTALVLIGANCTPSKATQVSALFDGWSENFMPYVHIGLPNGSEVTINGADNSLIPIIDKYVFKDSDQISYTIATIYLEEVEANKQE